MTAKKFQYLFILSEVKVRHFAVHDVEFFWFVILNIVVPEAPPQNLLAISDNSSVIHITWDAPPDDTINGELKSYEILYSKADAKVFSVITFELSDSTVSSWLSEFDSYVTEIWLKMKGSRHIFKTGDGFINMNSLVI